MKPVRNYMKNVMKSVAYASADVARSDLMPNVGEFMDSNKSFIASTYTAIRHPKTYVKKKVDSFKDSKYYTALDYTAKNLVEDLRTGNFYNKAREEEGTSQFGGSAFDVSDWNDLSEWDVDMSDLDNDNWDDTITAGDAEIVKSIEATSKASTNATTNAILAASEMNVKNSRANIGILYNQNEKLFSGLHSDLSMANATMDSMHKVIGEVLPNIDKNLSDFFSESSKTSKKILAMMEESLEMQRNMYKDANTKQQEEIDKKNSKAKKLRYSDVVLGEGLPDIEQYIEMVKQNIKSNSQAGGMLSMLNGFGEDSNMLAMMGSSPLKGLVTGLIKGIIPATIKAGTKELDSMISGVFGTVMGKLANAKNNDDIGGSGIIKTLAKFLAPNVSVNKSLDASKYQKGAIPFDGITRKAIIDVIPTYLRRIEAAITGRQEIMFDYESGRWMNTRDVKNSFESIRQNSIDSATNSLMRNMNPGLNMVKGGLESDNEKKDFDKAIDEFKIYLYDHNGVFNPKVSAEKNDITSYQYPNLYKYYKEIQTVYTNYDVDTANGRHTKLSSRLISNSVMEAKDRENRQYRDLENKGYSVYGQYYSSGLRMDQHIKYDKDDKGRETITSIKHPLLETKDTLGNNIFNYLQKITAELGWQRTSGFSNIYDLIQFYGGTGGGGPQSTFNPVGPNGPLPMPNNTRRIRSINMKSNSLTDSEVRSMVISTDKRNEEERKSKERIDIDTRTKQEALAKIHKHEAVSKDMFNDDELEYITRLANMVALKATDDYRKEISGLANESEISAWLNKYVYRPETQTSADIKKSLEKKEKEQEKEDNESEDSKSNIKKLMDEFKLGKTKLNAIMSAPAEVFTNLLYTADRAIYDMMFKAKIKSDDEDEEGNNTEEEYDGFLDMLAGKSLNLFKKAKETIQNDVLDPLKKKLGIDDDFTDRFKETFKNIGGQALKFFKDSYKEVYSPVIDTIKKELGIEPGEKLEEKNRRINRESTTKDIEYVQNNQDVIDDRFLQIAKDAGLKVEDYNGNIDAMKADITKVLNKRLYDNSNNLKEFTNMDEFDRMISAIKDMEDPTSEFAKIKKKNDLYGTLSGENIDELSDNIRKLAENIDKMQINNTQLNAEQAVSNVIGEDDVNKQRRWLYQNKLINNADVTSKSDKVIQSIFNQQKQNQILRNLYSTDKDGKSNKLNAKMTGSEDITNTQSRLIDMINMGILDPDSKEYKYIANNPEAINKRYLRSLLGNEQSMRSRTNISSDIEAMAKADDEGRQKILDRTLYNDKLRKLYTDNLYNNEDLTDDQKQKARIMLFEMIDNGELDSYSPEFQYIMGDYKAITKKYLRSKLKNTAYGTPDGKPFMGATMLSKGELLFNDDGVSVVNKTDAYDINKPTHILNSYDSNPILKELGLDYGPRKTPEQDLEEENRVKDKLFNNANGTINNLITNHAEGTQKKYDGTVRNDDIEKLAEEDADTNGETIANSLGDAINGVRTKFNDSGINFDEMKQNAKKYAPEAAASGVIGAIATTLLGVAGGPLLGALVGSAAGVIGNSEDLKDKFFGAKDDKGKRHGGKLFNDKIMHIVNDYVPDIAKYGVAGILPGLITPLGPIGGLLLGGAIGFLKNNDSFMTKYFGEVDENGNRTGGKITINSKTRRRLKQMLPGAGIGAGVGAVAGLFVGPFGILGNAALGSALGMMASTDEFKDSILGKSINGVRSGGLLGAIRDAFEPLKKTFQDVGKKLIDIIDKNIADPLQRFITPFINRLPRIMGFVPKIINRFLENHIATPAGKFLQRVLFDPASKIVKIAANAGAEAFKWVTTPFRALGKVGDHMRKKDIQNGYADYMTAQERIDWMQDHGKVIKDKDGNIVAYSGEKGNNNKASLKFDRALADIGREGSQFENIDDAKALLNNMTSITDTVSDIDRARKGLGKDVANRLSGWKGQDGASLTPKAIKAVTAALSKNNIKKARDVLTTYKLSNGRMMTPEEYTSLMASTDDGKGLSLDNQFRRFTDFAKRKEIAGSMTKESRDSMMAEVSKAFQEQFGIKIEGSNDLKRYASMLDTEITNADVTPERREEKALYSDNTEQLKTLNNRLAEISNILKKLYTGSDDELRSRTVRTANDINDAAEVDTENRLGERIQRVKEYSRSENDETINKLTESDTRGSKISRNPVTNKVVNAIDALKGDKYKKFWNKGILNDNTVKDINYKNNNLKQTASIVKSGYKMTDDAIIEFNKYTKGKAKDIKQKMTDPMVKKLFTTTDKVTEEDIKAISKTSKEDLIAIAYSLTQAGYNLNNKKIKDIIKIGRQKAREAANYNNLNEYLPEEDEEQEVETINTEDEEADNVAPANHGIGTFLLSAIGKGAKTVGSLALKGGKALLSKGLKGVKKLGSKAASSVIDKITNRNSDQKMPNAVSNLDEVDKPNDGKDIVVNPETGEGMVVKQQSDGSVVPDTSDNQTKSIINRITKEREERKKMQEDIAKSTQATQEGIGDQEQGGKKLKWWQLLLAGIVAAPFLKKIFDGVVKPLWDNKLKPWIKDTAIPWITDTALPALGNVIVSGVKVLADLLIDALPGIIKGALGFAKDAAGAVLDTVTGNDTNVGGATTVNTSEHDSNEVTTMTDDSGKKLTYGDIANNNYEGNIRNEQGAVATNVDENGNVTFQDESKHGEGFVAQEKKTMLNAFKYGKAGGGKLNQLLDKAGTKLLKRKGILKPFKKTGKVVGALSKVITKPIAIAGNIGNYVKERGITNIGKDIKNSKFASTVSNIVNKVKNVDKSKMAEKLADAAESGGVKGKIAKVVKAVPDAVEKLFSNSKVVKKVAELAENIGVKNASKWIVKFKDGIKSIFVKAMETNSAKYAASAVKSAVNTVGKLITPIMLAIDFVTGCDKAEKILGVSDTSIVEEVVAGIINALCNFLILPSIFPGTEWIARAIFKLFPSSDIEARQKEADEEAKKYNEDNGTTYTTEEYLNRKKSFTGKVGGWFSDRWKDVKSFFGGGKGEKETNKTINKVVKDNEKEANNNNSAAYNNDESSNNNSEKKEGFLAKAGNWISDKWSKVKSFFGGGKYDKQIDPSIANLPFNASYDTDKQTIGDSACGPVAAVNAVKSIDYGKGTNDVLSASAYAIKNGYKEKDGGTTPDFFNDYFNKQGLNSNTTSNKNELANRIKAGQPTVLMGSDSNGISRNTPYGTNPHYVTVTGTDGRGNAIVQDPESKYDNQLYNINKLMSKSSFGVSVSGKGSNARFKSRYGRSKYGRGLRGSTLEEQAFNFFIDNGFAKGAAAGAVGNLMAESGFDHIDPSAVESNGEGVGIVQWSFSRKTSFLNYCQSQGKPFPNDDIGLQLAFCIKEIKGDGVEKQWAFDSKSGWDQSYNMSLEQFLSCNDPNLAAGAWCACFERPNKAKSHIDQRITNAINVYNQYSGNSPVSGNAMSTDGDSSSSSSDVASGLVGILSQSKAGQALSAFTSFLTGSSSDSSSSTDTSSTDSSSSSTGSASGPTEAATAQMEAWADDPNVGYDQTYRWGEKGDYDCSAAVITAWTKAGVDLKGAGASYTGNLYDTCIQLGFKDVTSSVNLSNGEGLQRGDILLNKGHHVAMWTGSEIVNASRNENGGATGGQPGDQDGKEFLKRPYYNYPWDCVLRYGGGSSSGTGSGDNYKLLSKLGTYLDNDYIDGKGNNVAAMKQDKPLSGLGTYNKKNKPGTALDGFKKYRNRLKNVNGMGTIDKSMANNDTFSAGDTKNRNFKADEPARLEKVAKANAKASKSGKGALNLLDGLSGYKLDENSTVTDLFNNINDFNNRAKGKVDFDKLLRTIIDVLNTIADNTDKMDTIVKILNERLGTNVTAKEVSSKNKNKLKDKLRDALSRQTNDKMEDDSMYAIMNTMNAIASE